MTIGASTSSTRTSRWSRRSAFAARPPRIPVDGARFGGARGDSGEPSARRRSRSSTRAPRGLTNGGRPIRLRRAGRTPRTRLGLMSFVLWGPGEAGLARERRRGIRRRGGRSRRGRPFPISSSSRATRHRWCLATRVRIHIAAAVATPIVGLYGPTSPARNGPWSPATSPVRASTRCECHHQRRCRRPTPGASRTSRSRRWRTRSSAGWREPGDRTRESGAPRAAAGSARVSFRRGCALVRQADATVSRWPGRNRDRWGGAARLGRRTSREGARGHVLGTLPLRRDIRCTSGPR